MSEMDVPTPRLKLVILFIVGVALAGVLAFFLLRSLDLRPWLFIAACIAASIAGGFLAVFLTLSSPDGEDHPFLSFILSALFPWW